MPHSYPYPFLKTERIAAARINCQASYALLPKEHECSEKLFALK